jgi:hypothetical protein
MELSDYNGDGSERLRQLVIQRMGIEFRERRFSWLEKLSVRSPCWIMLKVS